MSTYKQLQQALNLQLSLPVTPDWSAAADFLFLIKDYCLTKTPETIVECSSGLSTLILSRCCQLNQFGHVYSLENGKEYQIQTQQNLENFNLQSYADVFYAPLETISVTGNKFDWYQAKTLKNLEIDLLVIDGPPGFIQKNSRLPALPILFEQLSQQSCIFLDDAAREDEKEIVAIWLAEYPGLTHEYIETERGCSIILINKCNPRKIS